MPVLRSLLVVLLLLACAPAGAGAASAPDAGVAFAPPDPGPPVYDVAAAPVVRTVVGADGVELRTETWLPVARPGGPAVPEKLPVVLWISPYAVKGAKESAIRVDPLVARGYAFTQAHARGSGGSGGCQEQTAQNEASDGARFVEDAGERAPWASGAVGTFGSSSRGGTQLAAATADDPSRLRSLKAMVVGNPVASAYEFFAHDGVPHLLQASINAVAYPAYLSSPQDAPEKLPERIGCQPEISLAAADQTGDFTPFYADRDHTRRLDRVRAATLMWHGHADTRVHAHGQIGLFDGLPAGVPKHGLFGVFDHEHPDAFRGGTPQPRADWQRADWMAMVIAWMDRYVRGTRNGVDDWPVAQVQGTDGQWRSAEDWPARPGGRAGRLLLGPSGVLGAPEPSGSTAYTENPAALELTGVDPPDGSAAVFTTPVLQDRLELWGVPELDAWVVLDQPDAHLAVKLEALGPDGRVTLVEGRAIGARSLRHLEPFDRGRFRQAAGRDAPVGVPVRVPVRLGPTDLVVPKGGRLRLTLTGSVQAFDGLDGLTEGLGALVQGPSAPSGRTTRVEVLHSCAHPSALRFVVPDAGSQLLDVREDDQEAAALGTATPAPAPPVDGGGLARAVACGEPVDDGASAAPRLRLSLRPHKRSVRGAARRGVRVRTICSSRCRVRLRAEVSRSVARTLGLRTKQPSLVLGRRTATLPAGSVRELVVPLSPGLRRTLLRHRRLRLTVVASATTTTGLRADRRKPLILRG